MSEHPHDLLGPYSLEALDRDTQSHVSAHLADCPGCREELSELDAFRLQLEQIPPEAFLDGPPEGGDLLLARTLRQARAESHRPRVWAIAAAVLVVLAAIGGGLLVGRQSSGPSPLAGGPGAPRSRPATLRTAFT